MILIASFLLVTVVSAKQQRLDIVVSNLISKLQINELQLDRRTISYTYSYLLRQPITFTYVNSKLTNNQPITRSAYSLLGKDNTVSFPVKFEKVAFNGHLVVDSKGSTRIHQHVNYNGAVNEIVYMVKLTCHDDETDSHDCVVLSIVNTVYKDHTYKLDRTVKFPRVGAVFGKLEASLERFIEEGLKVALEKQLEIHLPEERELEELVAH